MQNYFDTKEEAESYLVKNHLFQRIAEYIPAKGKWALIFPLEAATEKAYHFNDSPGIHKHSTKKELIYCSKVCGNVPVTISVRRYANDNSLCVTLHKQPDEYGDDYFGSITVNLPAKLPEDCAFIDTNKLSGVLPFLKKYGLAKPVSITANSNWCAYPLFQFNLEKLREYTSEDVQIFENA